MRLLVRALQTIIRYVVWLLLFGLGLWAMLETRTNLFDILVRAHVRGWAIPAFTNFYLVAVILIWLAVSVWLENYLTEPADVRVFWRRGARAAAIIGGILVASFALQALL